MLKNVHHYRAIEEEDTKRQALRMETTTHTDNTPPLHTQDNHQQALTAHQVTEALMLLGPEGLRASLMGVMGASLREHTTMPLKVGTGCRAAEEARASWK